jgi:ATP-binding cassette, subfamily D (ALD), member 3
LYKQYMKSFTYYQVINLDNRTANPDQILTQDVDKFATSVSDLYSNISKPILDIFIYARELNRGIGWQGPASLMGYMVGSGIFLSFLRKPLASQTMKEQQLEGEFRAVNARLITHAEEVAFYIGNERETQIIGNRFDNLMAHLRRMMNFRFSVGVVDTIVAKYVATMVGYIVVSIPFLNIDNPRFATATHGQLLQEYFTSARTLIALASSIGRLILAGREMNRLAGFTARVVELIDIMKDLGNKKYERTMIATEKKDDFDASSAKNTATAVDAAELVPFTGKLVQADFVIEFNQVPVVTPNKDVLIRSLSFKVEKGMNLMIVGPNGCGKSSLFRLLGELWPLFGGTLIKPSKKNIFYVPQRPYLALGSLRDQIIYPHSVEEMPATMTDADLRRLLNDVRLEYLADRDGGLNAVCDWADVLSGGEKQRVAMARMFYHRPQFAVLDECTSAVSVDVEGFLYKHAEELGITILTCSHRQALWKYHQYKLEFLGNGQYTFEPMPKQV